MWNYYPLLSGCNSFTTFYFLIRTENYRKNTVKTFMNWYHKLIQTLLACVTKEHCNFVHNHSLWFLHRNYEDQRMWIQPTGCLVKYIVHTLWIPLMTLGTRCSLQHGKSERVRRKEGVLTPFDTQEEQIKAFSVCLVNRRREKCQSNPRNLKKSWNAWRETTSQVEKIFRKLYLPVFVSQSKYSNFNEFHILRCYKVQSRVELFIPCARIVVKTLPKWRNPPGNNQIDFTESLKNKHAVLKIN